MVHSWAQVNDRVHDQTKAVHSIPCHATCEIVDLASSFGLDYARKSAKLIVQDGIDTLTARRTTRYATAQRTLILLGPMQPITSSSVLEIELQHTLRFRQWIGISIEKRFHD